MCDPYVLEALGKSSKNCIRINLFILNLNLYNLKHMQKSNSLLFILSLYTSNAKFLSVVRQRSRHPLAFFFCYFRDYGRVPVQIKSFHPDGNGYLGSIAREESFLPCNLAGCLVGVVSGHCWFIHHFYPTICWYARQFISLWSINSMLILSREL